MTINHWEDSPINLKKWHQKCNNVLRLVPHRGRFQKFEEYFLNVSADVDNTWLTYFFMKYTNTKSQENRKSPNEFQDLFDFDSVGFLYDAVTSLLISVNKISTDYKHWYSYFQESYNLTISIGSILKEKFQKPPKSDK